MVFWIGAGYVQFQSSEVAVAPVGVPLEDGYFIALSRRSEATHGPRHPEEAFVMCPNCGIYPLAANGLCMGGCDE